MHREFDNVEDAFAWMKEQEEKANENIVTIQRHCVRGTYALRVWSDIVIFGYILTVDEIRDGERRAGADEGELNFTMQILASSYERGYRFGRWYSVVEPNGELGDAHISTLFPIRKEDFEYAKSRKWSIPLEDYRLMLQNNMTRLAREN